MRIASLVPSATESLFALGLGEQVVAVTHECDYPDSARRLPALTRTVLEPGLDAAAIDAAVRERTARGEALYELDHELLRSLEPDLIVTQALCEVCAVSVDDVRAVAADLAHPADVVSLDPTTLEGVLADLALLGGLTGSTATAERLIAESRRRLGVVAEAVAGAGRPRVIALEWLDPPYVGGHWVPEMIGLAGGVDPLGSVGGRSQTVSWETLSRARADLVVAMPCGYDTERAAKEAWAQRDSIRALDAGRVAAVDASAYFSRPGPRLVDGVELLGHLIHPDLVGAPAAERWLSLDIDSHRE